MLMVAVVSAYKKAGDNACLPNNAGDTPLHLAALSSNSVAIDWLLDPLNCDIDLNLVNKYA